MTKKEKLVLIESLNKLSKNVADIAALFEGAPAPENLQEAPAKEADPSPAEEAPAKAYTYEEARAILAEKVRSGFRAEVKAILNAHGIRLLSEVEDARVLDAIVAEAEVIGNG